MPIQTQQIEQVMHKLQGLSSERITEVEDFVDLLRQRDTDRQLTGAAMAASEPVLNEIWDNLGDAEYDQL